MEETSEPNSRVKTNNNMGFEQAARRKIEKAELNNFLANFS